MSAERGWLGEPPSQQDRTPPSHRYKWYKMMGATDLLPKTRETEEGRGNKCLARLDQ
jgi:hypothetical protein